MKLSEETLIGALLSCLPRPRFVAADGCCIFFAGVAAGVACCSASAPGADSSAINERQTAGLISYLLSSLISNFPRAVRGRASCGHDHRETRTWSPSQCETDRPEGCPAVPDRSPRDLRAPLSSRIAAGVSRHAMAFAFRRPRCNWVRDQRMPRPYA